MSCKQIIGAVHGITTNVQRMNKDEEQLLDETKFSFESMSCVLSHVIITILTKEAVVIKPCDYSCSY